MANCGHVWDRKRKAGKNLESLTAFKVADGRLWRPAREHDEMGVQRPKESSPATSLDRTVQVLMALTLIAPALCLGAVHSSVLAAAGLLGAGLLCAVLIHPRLRTPRLDLVSLVLVGLAGFTALQLLPLPSGLVSFINPAVHELRSRALRPLGDESAGFLPLSLDVSLTAAELVKLCLYLCVYWSCQSWIRYKGSRQVSVMIAVAGGLGAVVLLGHRVLLLDLVYGVYKPLHLSFSAMNGRISAPLLNENHMAALLGLGATMAIGLALEIEDRSRRILAIAGASLIGGALLLTFSRGGIIAFVFAQMLLLTLRLLHRTRKRQGGETGGHLGWVPLGLAATLGLGFFTAQDLLVGEFLNHDTSKLEMARWAAPLIRDFWTTGVGRGAFWVGFGAYDPQVSLSTATHAENIVVQILCDYGLIVGIAAIAGFVVVLVRELRDVPRRPTRAAALSAVVGFGIHNLVDFSSEVPGVAVLAVATLAVVRFGGLRALAEPAERVVRLPRPAAWAAVMASLVACALIPLLVIGHTVDEDERTYRKAYLAQADSAFEKTALRQVLARHPAVAYVPFVTGVRLYQRKEGNPLPWLSRALELSPHHAPAHLYVGLSLMRIGHLSQGLLELRLAATYAPHLLPRIADLLIERYPDFDVASRIAVTNEERRRLWPSLADALASRNLSAETAKADDAILALDPVAPRSLARLARRHAEIGQLDEAFAAANKLCQVSGFEAAGAILDAQLHRQQGDHRAAVSTLEAQLRHQPRHPGLLTELAWARLRAGDRPRALEAATTVRNLAQTSPARAAGYALEAELENAAGNVRAAMSRLRDAHNIDPSRTDYLWRLAALAEGQADDASLIDALRKITVQDSSDERAIHKLAELESRRKKQILLGESR